MANEIKDLHPNTSQGRAWAMVRFLCCLEKRVFSFLPRNLVFIDFWSQRHEF